MIQKTDDPKTIVQKDQLYLVPCFVYDRENYETTIIDYEKYNLDKAEWDGHDMMPHKIVYLKDHRCYPVLNHPHNDKENGQKYTHWHVDFRFNQNTGPRGIWLSRVNETDFYFPQMRFEYKVLRCLTIAQTRLTSVHLISKSKLKHDCIHKGKCPHRGYDLSNEPVINGVITCPLHGLRFDSLTKQLIKF